MIRSLPIVLDRSFERDARWMRRRSANPLAVLALPVPTCPLSAPTLLLRSIVQCCRSANADLA